MKNQHRDLKIGADPLEVSSKDKDIKKSKRNKKKKKKKRNKQNSKGLEQ